MKIIYEEEIGLKRKDQIGKRNPARRNYECYGH